MRVVLVEDNLLVRGLEADILSGSGYEVATAASAEGALQLLDERAAILITDIRLPGGTDGFALAKTARQRQPDLAIMLVGADMDNLALPDLEGIADEALSKPFTIDEFEQRLATLARIVEALAAIRGTRSNELHADAIAAKEREISKERARVRAWRMRAEELRTIADSYANPSAQESLRRAATNYDQRANHLEAMLEGRPSAPEEKAG